jgi:hypothetical protein
MLVGARPCRTIQPRELPPPRGSSRHPSPQPQVGGNHYAVGRGRPSPGPQPPQSLCSCRWPAMLHPAAGLAADDQADVLSDDGGGSAKVLLKGGGAAEGRRRCYQRAWRRRRCYQRARRRRGLSSELAGGGGAIGGLSCRRAQRCPMRFVTIALQFCIFKIFFLLQLLSPFA